MKIRDKKRLILNIAVIFLIVMLILTFFSNTIMNWSLVEVETSSINSGTVTTEIRDMVAVSTISDYQVTLPQSRKIATIQVSLGDKVKPGDLLFTLEGAGDEELEPAEKELEQLKLEYQTALLSIKIPPYAVENAEIQTLQKALEQAVAERNALGNTSLTLTEAQSRMLNAQNEQSLQNEAVNKLQNELAQIEANDPALSSIRELVLAVQEANAALSQKQLLYDNTAAELGQNYNELLAYISELQQEIDGMEWDDPQRVEALERLGNLQDSLAVISPLYAELSTAKGALDKANNALESKKQSEKRAMLQQLDAAQLKQNEAAKKAKEAEKEYNNVQRIKDAEAAVQSAQNALNSRVLSLESQQNSDNTEQKKAQLRLDSMSEEIKKKEVKLAELKANVTGQEVCAYAGGIVTSINAQVGATALADEVLAEVSVLDTGFEAVLPVTEEVANQLSVGMAAEVYIKSGNYVDVTAEIQAIRTDIQGQIGLKMVSLRLQGDLSIGQFVMIVIPLNSQVYDIVVPKSAVYDSESGEFVLALKTKSSPLGNRYYAEKVPVTVLAQDGYQAAVSCDLSTDDQIIIRANGMVNGGDFVRLNRGTDR